MRSAQAAGDEVMDADLNDLRCVNCGYDIRGLPGSGDCPECGWALRRSIGGPLLRHADFRLISRLHWGLWMLHRGSIAAIGALLALLALMVYGWMQTMSPTPSPSSTLKLIYVLILTTLMGWSALVAAGLVLITWPSRRLDKFDRTEPFLARLVLPLGAAVPLLWLVFIRASWTAITPIVELMYLLAFVLVWLFCIVLVRWLDRIERQVERAVLTSPPWPTNTRLFALVDEVLRALMIANLRGDPSSHLHLRRAAPYVPAFILALAMVLRVQHGPSALVMLITILALPLGLLFSLGRTVRAVRHERNLARTIPTA